MLKVYSDGSRRTLHILELLVKEAARPLLPSIVNFCFWFAADHGAETITAWLPGQHSYAASFDAAGLTIEPSQAHFVFITIPHTSIPELRNRGSGT